MTKYLLRKTSQSGKQIKVNKLLSELEPEMRHFLKEAARDLLQPRQEVIDRILHKAALNTQR